MDGKFIHLLCTRAAIRCWVEGCIFVWFFWLRFFVCFGFFVAFFLFCFCFCLVGVFLFVCCLGFFAIAVLLAFIKNCAFCIGGVEGWEF